MSAKPISLSPAPKRLRPRWPYPLRRPDFSLMRRGGLGAMTAVKLSPELAARAIQTTSTTFTK